MSSSTLIEGVFDELEKSVQLAIYLCQVCVLLLLTTPFLIRYLSLQNIILWMMVAGMLYARIRANNSIFFGALQTLSTTYEQCSIWSMTPEVTPPVFDAPGVPQVILI